MTRVRLIFEKQGLHALLLAILALGSLLVSNAEAIRVGQLWGIGTTTWFWLAIASAVVHQVFVWFCWRTQLHASLLTRTLGDLGFPVYAVLFAILGIARVVMVCLLAIANGNTLIVNLTVMRVLAVIFAAPAAYLFYSVKRYFGFTRAFGIDHFDVSYRSIPFVRKGIFRFTSNGMYVFGFLLLYVPGLWYASAAALCAALFNHAYIWVHYYCTELPDISRIYAGARAERVGS